MPDGEKSPGFYEQRWFRTIVAVLGVITALLAIAGPLRGVIESIFPGAPEPVLNTQVIFDTSDAMGEPFHGKDDRRDAGVEALTAANFLRTEGVGLRRTEPRCPDESGDPVVPIDTDNAEKVRETAAKLPLEGKSHLVGAVRSAVEEFAKQPYGDDPSSQKRIVVISSGTDECSIDMIGELVGLLSGAGARPADSEFKLFGLNATPREEQRLMRLRKALKRAGAPVRVWTPHNVKQLYRAVEEMNEEAEQRPDVPPGEKTIPDGG